MCLFRLAHYLKCFWQWLQPLGSPLHELRCEIVWCKEGLLAIITPEVFLPFTYEILCGCLDCIILWSKFGKLVAAVGYLPCMNSDVRFQTVWCKEGHWAIITSKGFLPFTNECACGYLDCLILWSTFGNVNSCRVPCMNSDIRFQTVWSGSMVKEWTRIFS